MWQLCIGLAFLIFLLIMISFKNHNDKIEKALLNRQKGV